MSSETRKRPERRQMVDAIRRQIRDLIPARPGWRGHLSRESEAMEIARAITGEALTELEAPESNPEPAPAMPEIRNRPPPGRVRTRPPSP